MKYIINKKFTATHERSPRVIECAEAFGLGLDDRSFTIYDNFEVDIEHGDIVYITGQSGSGKSLMLSELSRQMQESGLKVADIDEVELLDKPLIDQIGTSTSSAIELLNLAGINDAYLFLRKPKELSDGQRYRMKIAKLMESDAQVWVADEFGAILDRVTARVVSFNLHKFAKRAGVTAMVATTHTDLVADLQPDLVIHKRYGTHVDVSGKNIDQEAA